ncbi:unnamed protein product [Paramecium pentaurelia]|uniref:Prenylcysteine lyase domain-containing protein n=1 Tax=Paramecium pentaurelia TaxID=43138 RepID=A0A8S1SB20_9CILI|nr:unnamed protein product [Paramecium pentaurelia]
MIFILNLLSTLASAQRVAIVGCGIGGATLAQLIPSAIVYESYYQCGGRINHVLIPGLNALEFGATFFIKENEYVQKQIEQRNLEYYKRDLGKLAILKNKQLVLQKADSDVINIVKMVYNYGLSPKKMKDITDEVLINFKSIYSFLESGKYYKNFDEFLQIIKLNDIKMNFTEYLNDNGIDQKFQEEFVDAILLAIYNQKGVNTIAGLISMIAAFNDAYSIKGGNRQLIDEEKINVIHSKVDIIHRLQNGKYQIFNDEYDYVVMASLVNLDISFDNIREMNSFQYVKYQSTYVYVVAGKISQKYLGVNPEDLNTIIILDDTNVTELKQECVKCFQGWNVYKVQGRSELQLDQIFETHQIVHKKVWDAAYPQLNQNLLNTDFEYEKNFFYLNSIESLASCMELMMIQAKNIANIIKERHSQLIHEDL